MKELIFYVAIIVVSMIFSAIQKKNKERKKQQHDAFPFEGRTLDEFVQQEDSEQYAETYNEPYPEKPSMIVTDSGIENYLLPETRIEPSYFSYDDHLDSDYSDPISSLEDSSITSPLNLMVSPLLEASSEEVELDFDLREAVIYSEILTPKYKY